MSEDRGISSRGPFPALPALAIMLIVSAVVLQLPPLTSSRPHHDPLADLGKASDERVRARLWQDPLQVVYAEHQKRRKEVPGVKPPDITGELSKIQVELRAIKGELMKPAPPGENKPDWRFNLKINPASGERMSTRGELPDEGSHENPANEESGEDSASITARGSEFLRHLYVYASVLHSTNQAREEVEDQGLLILSVLLHGGPYPEDAENRMRTRYAVLSALGQAGYKPKQSEHIRYVSLLDLLDRKERERQKRDFLIPFERFDYSKIVPKRAGDFTPVYVVWIDEDALQDPGNVVYDPAVPFDWRLSQTLGVFERELLRKEHRSRIIWKATRRVLSQTRQLYSGEEWPAIQSEIRSKIDERVGSPELPRTDYRVIGPVDSESLLKMRRPRQLKPLRLADRTGLPDLTFYSPWATVPDQVLQATETRSRPVKPPPGKYQEMSPFFSLYRTTAGDDKVFAALLRELELRDASPARDLSRENTDIEERSKYFNPKNHMVLIGEWDTLYGRARRCTLLNVIISPRSKKYDCRSIPEFDQIPHPNVHFISYLRGLDGQLPDEEKAERLRSKDTTTKRDKAELKRELPAGRAQLDYLRRLQKQLRKLEQELSANGEELKSIGVIGSDVYDKLLILKALRPHFPRAVFFTTDLDAHMAHPSEYEHTRNLIVASPYGLTLHDKLQRGTPPFRDSYQTAIYLTTLYAIGDKEARDRLGEHFDVPEPRVYEIGRSGAYDLWPTGKEERLRIHPKSDRDRNTEWWAMNRWNILLVPACLVVLAFPLLAAFRPIGRDAKGFVEALGKTVLEARRKGWNYVVVVLSGFFSDTLPSRIPARWLRVSIYFVSAATIVTALYFLTPVGFDSARSAVGVLWQAISNQSKRFAEDFTKGHLEPFVMLEGISAWPTEFIRGIVCILSVYFLHSMHERLSSDRDDTEKRCFGQKIANHDSSEIVLKWRTRYFLTDAGVKCSNVRELWKVYWKLGRTRNRLTRAGINTIVYVGFGMLLLTMLGFPNRHIRGALCPAIDRVLLVLSVALLIFLVFYVLDATRLCNLFIRKILDQKVIWQRKTKSTSENAEYFEERSDVGLDNLRKIRLISERTKSVGRGVKYPFIVLFLMIVSRNSVFDNWDLPIGLILIFVFAFAAVLFCGWLLRRSAREAREVALDVVKAERDKLLDESPPVSLEDERIKRLDDAIDQINGIRTGAFSSVGESPILGAPLIPAGLYGLTELASVLGHRLGGSIG